MIVSGIGFVAVVALGVYMALRGATIMGFSHNTPRERNAKIMFYLGLFGVFGGMAGITLVSFLAIMGGN